MQASPNNTDASGEYAKALRNHPTDIKNATDAELQDMRQAWIKAQTEMPYFLPIAPFKKVLEEIHTRKHRKESI